MSHTKQEGQRIEFRIGAAIKVLYDDGEWYPGHVMGYTETTHKFRFKLTDVSTLAAVRVCMSVCVSVRLIVKKLLYVYVCVCVCVSVHLTVKKLLYVYVCLCVCPSV